MRWRAYKPANFTRHGAAMNEDDKQRNNSQTQNITPAGNAPAARNKQEPKQEEHNTMLSWDEFNSDDNAILPPVMQPGFANQLNHAGAQGNNADAPKLEARASVHAAASEARAEANEVAQAAASRL